MVLSCFGKLCATEASKQPKKRYNDYVPAVFPSETPDWRSSISASTARNISTVQDYVGENIQRAPKVSRRLWRRILADHSHDAALGQVKVGVHCYIGLLSSMNEGDTSLLAEELIRKEDSVAPLLLSARGDSTENKCRIILGLELLVHFIRAQSSSDVASLLAEHTQQACAPTPLKQLSSSSHQQTMLFVDKIESFVQWIICVDCDRSQIVVSNAVTKHVQATAQDWLLSDSKETGITALDGGFVLSQQVDDIYTTTKTSTVAQAVLQELALLCQDATVGSQVVANGLQSISSHRAWDGGARQQVTLQELRTGQQASGAQLLLLSGLLDELRNPSLQEGAAPAVLQAASQEASSLPSSLKPSALAKVLTATSLTDASLSSIHILASMQAVLLPLDTGALSTGTSHESEMVGECVKALTRDCKEPELMMESIATTLSGANYSNPQASIRKVKAAHIAIRSLPTGVQAPTALYTELCRLATLPASAAGEPPLALQACATHAATDALQRHGGVLKPTAMQALLQNIDSQLAPTARHTPPQLCAAAALHHAVVTRAPAESVVHSISAAVPRIGGATAAPRGAAEAVEVICSNQHCLDFGFQRLQPPQKAPVFLPPGSCVSLREDPATGRLVATGVEQDEGAAGAAMQAMQQHGQAEKLCAEVEQVLAAQPAPGVASKGAATGATWAPSAETLADAAAREDGGGYVLESTEPLPGSGLEDQRRTEDYANTRVGAVLGLAWAASAKPMLTDYRTGTPGVATPSGTTPAGTTPGGTTDDMDAYFMMPPSPAAPLVPFSAASGLQDHAHATAAVGHVDPSAEARPAAAAVLRPTDNGTPVPAPAWGYGGHMPPHIPDPSSTTPAPSMPAQFAAAEHAPSAPPQAHTMRTSENYYAPHVFQPAALQPIAPIAPTQAPVPPAAASSTVSSASGTPSTSLHGMLAAPLAAAPSARTDAGVVNEGSYDAQPSAVAAAPAEPATGAAQRTTRCVYNPDLSPNTTSAAAGMPQPPRAPLDAQGSVPQIGGGLSQISDVSVELGAVVDGPPPAVNDQSLSLPLGPPRMNKPLHVLSPGSAPKPPGAPSGHMSGYRDGISWSPPPIAIRSLHALPGGLDSHRGVTPTSSIGDVSSWSRMGLGRSIHAVSRDGNTRSQTELLTPERSHAPGSPSAMSVASCASSRRRGRPALHVIRSSNVGTQ